MTIAFIIPGRPTGKGRPKFARRGAGVSTYTDAKTASYENKVALFAQQAFVGIPAHTGAVEMTVIAYFKPPASASKVAVERMLRGDPRTHPTVKPDFDNIVKAVLDGLNGIAFADDKQVTWVNGGKRYGLNDQVYVEIKEDR